ncbi:MAG: N-acetylglucosamine kinase [Bacteroidia bacterium]|nr:N-acetylglucosamine kinase [Bacteroidia bacterium]
MILIADSGSTKTDWRLIDEKKQIHQFKTQGINPYFQTEEQIAEIIKLELIDKLDFALHALITQQNLNVFFYGAGCKAIDKKEIIKNALLSYFTNAAIVVESDMLAAAYALCGNKPGIVAILGTGANTCYYDGKQIVENKTSSGFILGDEGSGAHIGKTLVQAFLNDELPNELAKRFIERFKLSKEDIIDAVYRKPLPNRFLASFSKFVYQNIKEQYMIDLVTGCFHLFFNKYICKYTHNKNVIFHCTGSVAFYYSNILKAVANEKGIVVGTIVESPISALTLYHLGE